MSFQSRGAAVFNRYRELLNRIGLFCIEIGLFGQPKYRVLWTALTLEGIVLWMMERVHMRMSVSSNM